MSIKKYNAILISLVFVVLISTLYFLSTVSESLFRLFRLIFELRIVIVFTLGLLVGYTARPVIEIITKRNNR